MLKEINIKTNTENDTIDITDRVEKILKASKVKEGICCVYSKHTTCALLINENYDPNVMTDILNCLKNLVPAGKWLHDKVDQNADAHIKVALIGSSEVIPVKNGNLLLGKWQSINLAEFDGPKERTINIKIIKG